MEGKGSAKNPKTSAGSVEIEVTELFGVPVLRKYVNTVEKFTSNKKQNHSFTLLFVMLLSTMFCFTFMVGMLYYPPPLFKDLTESIFLNFGKGESTILEEKLTAANGKIHDLEQEIEKLKQEGLANFTREEELNLNLSTAVKEKEKLSEELSEANETIREGYKKFFDTNKALEDVKNKKDELQGDLDVCMKDKGTIKASLSSSEMQVSAAKNNLVKCRENAGQLDVKNKQIENEKSTLIKELGKSKNDLSKLENRLHDVQKKATETESILIDCKTLSEQLKETNTELSKNLKSSRMNEATQKKNFEGSQFKLGECKNKNMDHEVRAVELLTDLESCKKELDKC